MKPDTPQPDRSSSSPPDSVPPFHGNRGKRGLLEGFQKFGLLMATWTVLFIAIIIFGTIAWRGAPVLWKYGSGFLTQSPETLVVMKIPKNVSLSLPGDDLAQLQRSNPTVAFGAVSDYQIPVLQNSFVVPEGSARMMPALANALEEAGGRRLSYSERFENGEVLVEFKKALPVVMPREAFLAMQEQAKLTLRDERELTTESTLKKFSIEELAAIEMPASVAFSLRRLNEAALKDVDEETHSYSAGGVLGPLVGTALLVIICMIVALFVGVAASVYLSEYARQGSFMDAVRLAILNLAGVPSIVFGLFGLMLFVFLAPKVTNVLAVRESVRIPLWPSFSEPSVRQQIEREILLVDGKSVREGMRLANASRSKAFWNGRWYLSFEGWGTCMLAGGFTLAVMVLPVIITACEESLRAVPKGYREASLALGATKWQSIRTAVLPYAMPGILTASVLGITRVAGETAPIMFTAALAERSLLPWEGINRLGLGWVFDFLSQSVQALPYHIYTVAARIPQSDYTRPMQDGAVLVFMLFVMSFAGLSVWLRIRMRSKLKW